MKTMLFIILGAVFSSSLKALDVAEKAREIDALMERDWSTHGVRRNAPVDDGTFVRRIHLDLAGRIPTARETEAFLQSEAPGRRAVLIERLLASEGQVQHAFNYWADVLRLQTTGPETGKYSGVAYSLHLRDSLRANKPYDQLVRELITAQGKAWNNGAVGYYMRDRNMPLENLASTARIFLGTRIECAQCHNHPFDKWTQMQFHQLAAFPYVIQVDDYFSGNMGRLRDWMNAREQSLKRSSSPELPGVMEENRYISEALNTLRNYIRYTEHNVNDRRALRLPHDYQYPDAKPLSIVTPASIMGREIKPQPGETPLDAYARWLTSPEHPRFTKVIVNRLWKRVFGMALIEPPDEMTDTSAASNPALLEHLEKLMRELKYDMRAFTAVVCNTSAYQSQVTCDEVTPGADYHFTGPLLRRMTAEQMWDSFITLIHPSPDVPSTRVRRDLENRILAPKKLVDAIDALTLDEMIAGFRVAAERYKTRAAEAPKLQREMEALLAKGDTPSAGMKRSELNRMIYGAHGVMNHEVIHRGMEKLAAKLGTAPVIFRKDGAGKLSEEKASLDMMKSATGDGDPKEHVFITGHYDNPVMTTKQIAGQSDSQRRLWSDEADWFQLPSTELPDYFASRTAQTENWLRAADLDSPAPNGHYLREFGQSDRQTIENANHDASIPQALSLMNGEIMPQILDRHSQVMLTVRRSRDAAEQAVAIYTAVLSRKPTAVECQIWLDARKHGLVEPADLIWSLINTRQFIFVQ